MNAIFCIYNNGIIGIDGKLPSEVIPGLAQQPAVKLDMKMFRQVTKGATVVMGRNTWESLNRKPLPGRKNIIITSTPENLAKENPPYRFKDYVNYLTKDQFDKWYNKTSENVWIIGGVNLLKEYIPQCEQVYVNELHCKDEFEAIDEIALKRRSTFHKHELIEILRNSGFVNPDKNISYYLGPDNCFYFRDKVTLYTYRFVKDYRLGFDK